MKRIRRLLYPQEGPRFALTPVFSAAILTITAAAALMAWQSQAQTPPPVNPYKAWLDEDVAYIVSDAERAAFNLLSADEERDMFITQFWLRRDPTPGTPENEFKDEHYRRIAFADCRFSSPTLAGWRTDRGRIYISYGPPNEIESHPSGGKYTRPAEEGGGETSTYPFEQWRYRFIEGVGTNVVVEFVDTARTGVFRMTMDPNEKYQSR